MKLPINFSNLLWFLDGDVRLSKQKAFHSRLKDTGPGFYFVQIRSKKDSSIDIIPAFRMISQEGRSSWLIPYFLSVPEPYSMDKVKFLMKPDEVYRLLLDDSPWSNYSFEIYKELWPHWDPEPKPGNAR